MSLPLPFSPQPDRLAGLDTLRALAITLVFAHHYQLFGSGQATFGWVGQIGWVGVDLFFVLSGYLIANAIFSARVRGQPLSLTTFYARRALRTLPVFYVVLAAYFMFPAFMGGKTPPALWRFLTFTQNWQLQPGTAFSHAWSLCAEEQFYLVLPAAVLLVWRLNLRRTGMAWAWLLLLGLMGLGVWARAVLWARYGLEAGNAVMGYHPNIYYATVARADEFLPGIAIATLKNFHPKAWAAVQAQGQAMLVVGGLACAAMAYALVHFYYIDGYGYGFAMTAWGYSLVALSFAGLVIAALSPRSSLARLRLPGARSIALWSYAIYLSHKAVIFVLRDALRGMGGPDRQSLWTLGLILLVSLLIGALLHHGVEQPFMRWRDRQFPGKARPANQAVGTLNCQGGMPKMPRCN
ncbi:acyltransferase family protein [Roseateles koreensis]|uniref:Acyltransferase n=1 Tax=Roseateles koreensis TaxID=2987526 RepID=A0ABT5KPV8_9BURK|nr:acyltransferase [Roseateles koreensis]MDC8784495.1 acyltransferase [Roseateles koreensis]